MCIIFKFMVVNNKIAFTNKKQALTSLQQPKLDRFSGTKSSSEKEAENFLGYLRSTKFNNTSEIFSLTI